MYAPIFILPPIGIPIYISHLNFWGACPILKTMLKTIGAIVVFALVAFLAFQIYFFWQRGHSAQKEYDVLVTQLQKSKIEYQSLQSDFNYYLNPQNLLKEIRARFNFRAIGEKMIILVPRTPSSTQSQ